MDIMDLMLWIVLAGFFGFVVYILCGFARMLDERSKKQQNEVIMMSDRSRTDKEYVRRHADQYHNGDTERAKEDEIVKEVLPTLEME